MKRIGLAVTLSLIALLSWGCSDGETNERSMEQIYAEEGVPIRTALVEPAAFSSSFEYTAPLTGVKESSAFAAVSDKIDRIHYKVGDHVEKDAVVISFPTDNPAAQYYQAKVSFENAEASFERMQSYYEAGGLSRQNLDNARTSYEVARANWDAVRQSVKVRAPISGVLTSVVVRESDNVQKDDELFTVARVDRLKATVWVAEHQVGDIEIGAEAAADWQGHELRGSVVQVDLSMNQQRQAFAVVVEFDNPSMKVKPGVTADISLTSYTADNAIKVARKDILTDAAGPYVFIIDGDVAVKRPVTLGRSSDIDAEIIAGLSEGDVLVTEGQLLLADGKKVRLAGIARVTETE